MLALTVVSLFHRFTVKMGIAPINLQLTSLSLGVAVCCLLFCLRHDIQESGWGIPTWRFPPFPFLFVLMRFSCVSPCITIGVAI